MLTDGSAASILATRDWLEPIGQSQFHIDESSFSLRQIQELLSGADLPTRGLQTFSFVVSHHVTRTQLASRKARSRRRQTSLIQRYVRSDIIARVLGCGA